MIREFIAKAASRQNLSVEEAEAAMNEVMSGLATPAQIAGYLTALKVKGETCEEITGSARAMRSKAVKVKTKHPTVIDTCGTGGDGARTFNISTAAAFVLAGGGVPVAKHGNRSVSSMSGSADVLEALGININLSPEQVGLCMDETGFGFLFAPHLHTAMKHAIGPRRELGIPTIFNILGPLTNPASAQCQVVGVFSEGLVETIARVLANLGVRSALVVHGLDGLDEISISAGTRVAHLADGNIRSYYIEPEDFDLPRASLDDVRGGTPSENAAIIMDVLGGARGPRRDIVLLNAAAAFVAAGAARDIGEGIGLAREAIDSGRAMEKVEEVRRFTGRFASAACAPTLRG
ncbi:MAG TPA: anthranilate phosphoribosyltransferase [Firmicutes bacterium]|nr:anthranilate phosphoribosyltransferase [Bacillota bacterium]